MLSDLHKVLLFEGILTTLIATGFLERTYAFLLLGVLGAFFLTKALKESLELFFVSLPFYIALPLGINDSTSLWRPLSLLLFILWLWERRAIVWGNPLVFARSFLQRKSLLVLSSVSFLFLVFSTISLLWAKDLLIGVKTIIYFSNVFLLLFIVAWEIKKEDRISFLKKGAFVASFSLLIGFIQLALTFMTSLFTFWQWWAFYPIRAYYGVETSSLLSYSNTWFSYYDKGIPPTLRMFSLFQDSHAFAMFTILGLALFLALSYWYESQNDKKGKLLSYMLSGVSLLAIILSGSRGAWVGAGLLFIVFLCIRFLNLPFFLSFPVCEKRVCVFRVSEKRVCVYSKKGLILLLVFFILFPLASFLLYGQQRAQIYFEGKGDHADLRLAFFRARSSFDIEELSNKGRLEIWQDSFTFLKKRKFLTGTGIGNFPTALELSAKSSRKGASAHSLYLQFLVELGIFGFLAFLFILSLIIRHAYKTLALHAIHPPKFSSKIWEGKRYALHEYYAFAFLFAFLWILFYSLFDVTLLNDKVLLLSAILTGILYSFEKESSPKGAAL